MGVPCQHAVSGDHIGGERDGFAAVLDGRGNALRGREQRQQASADVIPLGAVQIRRVFHAGKRLHQILERLAEARMEALTSEPLRECPRRGRDFLRGGRRAPGGKGTAQMGWQVPAVRRGGDSEEPVQAFDLFL
jgi:hypothetical protein